MNRARFYAGVFLLAFATLMLEILETRLLSVMTWYHLAFFVISAAMFGMTGGAVFVYFRRERFVAASLARDLAGLTAAFALSTAVALAAQVTIAPALAASATMVVSFVHLAVWMALPFFFSGAAISLALTRSPFPIGRVYAADLCGAALGCLGVLAVLEWVDAPSAVLLTGAVAAAAAWLFAGKGAPGEAPGGFSYRLFQHPGWLFVVLAIVGAANATTRHGLQPLVVKNALEMRRGEYVFEKWNSFSRIIARPPVRTWPYLWGPSPHLSDTVKVRMVDLNIDGTAATAMYQYTGDDAAVAFLHADLTNLVYSIRRSGRAAVIGVGGGRDVLSAWTAGFRDVTGVELNPIFIGLLRPPGMFAEFAGLAKLPGVRLEVDEARSWFARTRERFDTIQMSMIDTFAATGAGAYSLSENGLYTHEGWRTFLSRLAPGGLFTVSRWYAPGELNETGRMVSLAMQSLFDTGARAPRQHLFMASASRIATLIVARDALTAEELATLRATCATRGFQIELDPGAATNSALLTSIVSARDARDLAARTRGLELDFSPPSDDRPFFFNMLPLAHALRAHRFMSAGGVVTGNLFATMTLLAILVATAGLVVLAVLWPASRAIGEVGRPLVTAGTAYFALIGLGFMLIEMGLLQRMSVFLGHPVYALSVVLFSLILSTGFGSWLSDRIDPERSRTLTAWAAAVAIWVALLVTLGPRVLTALDAAPMAARALVVTLLIAPGGVLMGWGFPLGMRLVERRDGRPTPWFWGVNGAAGVLASVLAVAISLTFGIRVTMLAGALCYLALIPAASALRAAPAHAQPPQRLC